MKNIISILLILFPFSLLPAQIDRSKAPEPGTAPTINIGDYESFTLDNGLQVFVVENQKIPRVSYSLRLDLNPVKEGDKAGYVNTAGQLLGTGTTNKTKAEIDQAIDYIGANVSTSANGLYASSLKKHNNQLLEIVSEILLEAEFRQEELDKIIQQKKSGLAYTKNDPGGLSNRVSNVLLYGNDHPFGELETEASLDNITLEDCKAYFNSHYRPNKAYLAVVGDITTEEAKENVTRYFGAWEKGDVPEPVYETPEKPTETEVAIVDRSESVQSVIKVTYPVDIKPNYNDYIAARITNTLLGGGIFRLFKNLREEHGYTYGAYSNLSHSQEIGHFTASANVRNEVTDSAVYEILYEMERIRTEPVPKEELKGVKTYLTGNFALSLENPQTIARFAINSAIYNLPSNFYTNYLKNLNAITAEELQKAAQKYILPGQAYIFIVGKKSEIADKLKRFDADSTITYYDENGNIIDLSGSAVPADIEAVQVIEKYIEAIGGKENLKEISDIKTHMHMEMQGMKVDVTLYKQKPNRFNLTMTMNGQVMSQQIYDGEKGVASGMQGKQNMEGEMLNQIEYESYLFPALAVLEDDVYEANITNIEKVNDSEAYVVEIKKDDRLISTEYFDKNTGYKIKSTALVKTPQGDVKQVTTFSDYQKVGNVKFPYQLSQTMGPGSYDIITDEVVVNEGIAADKFKVD
ncbi:MAG: insulinase family protein [Bacteroidetes bacterium]|jgi:predicted Zn-dependent peptidase/phosphotransferase system IIB component|nr:insulinase family protein [Bacteroidota bacterium]